MKTAIEVFTHTHKSHCKMNEFSLQEHRHCTCKRDAAEEEIVELIWEHVRLMDMTIDVDDDSIFTNELSELFWESSNNPSFGLSEYGQARFESFERKWITG